MPKEVIDAGVAVVVLFVVVIGLGVLGSGLRWIGKAGLAMATSLDNLRVSNEKQSQILQDMATRQMAGFAEVTTLGSQLSLLTEKIQRLPPDIQSGVATALDNFLDKLAEALRRTPGVPPDFDLRPGSRPVPFWARLFGLQ